MRTANRLAGVAILLVPVALGLAQSTLLDSAEDPSRWTFEPHAGTVERSTFSDGRPALNFTLPPSMEGTATLKVFPKDLDIAESDFLEFDYCVEGGMALVDVQLQHRNLNDGLYCHYWPIDHSDPVGRKHRLRMKLNRPENPAPSPAGQFEKSLDQPRLILSFQPVGDAGVARKIKIGAIQVVRKPYTLNGVIETNANDYLIGNLETVDKLTRYVYSLKCRNELDRELAIKLSTSGAKSTRMQMDRAEYRIPPKKTVDIRFVAEVLNGANPDLKEGQCEDIRVRIEEAGGANSEREIHLLAARPAPLAKSPRFLDFAAIRRKAALPGYMKQAFQEILAKADTAVRSPPMMDRFSDSMSNLPDEKFWGGDFCGYCSSQPATSSTFFRVLTSDPDRRLNRIQCLGCGRVYVSPLMNSVIVGNQFEALGTALENLAVAYMGTGDRRYAETAAAVLGNVADVFPTVPTFCPYTARKTYGACRWNFSQWMFGACMAYDGLKDTEFLNQDQKQRLRQEVFRPVANQLLGHEIGGFNSQLKFIDVSMVYLALALEDPQYLAFAVYSQRGILPILNRELTADGFGSENPSYDGFYLSLAAEGAPTLRLNGIDLFKDPKFMKLFDAAVFFAGPTGESAAWGPGGGLNLQALKRQYEPVYAVTGNPLYAYVAGLGGRRGADQERYALYYGVEPLPLSTVPEFKSVVFPEKGYFVLRAGQGDTLCEVPVYFGRHIRGGYMKLAFEFYAYQRKWSTRQGAAYGPLYEQYYVHPLSYPCIVVDGKRQRETMGRLTEWNIDGEVKVASAVVDGAYDDCQWERTFVLLEQSLLVIDHVQSSRPRRYEWSHHCAGTYEFSVNLVPRATKLADGLCYEVLKDVEEGESHGTWSYTVKPGSSGQAPANGPFLDVTMLGTDSTKVFSVVGPSGYGYGTEAPFVIARRETNATDFVAAYVPYAEKKRLTGMKAAPVTRNKTPVDRKDGMGLDVDFFNGHRYRVLIAYTDGPLESETYKSQRRVSVFQRK